jgi:sugar phosphate isomerase/epimerase
MTRLLYETIQFSPFLCDRAPDLTSQFAAAADAGYDGIGIDVWTVDALLDQGTTLDAIVAALDATGLACVELQALTIDPAMPTVTRPPRFTELVDAFRPEIVMAGFSGEVTGASIDEFAAAVDEVTAHGATVALEFLPMLPLDTIAKARDIVRRIGGRCGVCVDTWHFFRGPDTWADLEALPADELAYVQFNDALPLASGDLWAETLQRRAAPGDGELDLTRFCEIVQAKGYTGPVAVEVMSAELRALGPAEHARRTLAGARRYWP